VKLQPSRLKVNTPPSRSQTSLTTIVSSLKAQCRIQASTILSSRSSKTILDRLRNSQRANQSNPSNDLSPLIATAAAQRAHKEENLYRLCAGITTFRVQDPDPNAADSGNVLGIRFDVSNGGKFIRPYYVMLNKPWMGSELLRVHRHTMPPCIPLSSLAERHLPSGKGAIAINEKGYGSKKQDLRRFVRALRKEVVAYHNRISVIKSLRKEFKLDEKVSKKGKGREKVIQDISAADAEAKQVRIEWVDGRIGRAVVDEKGDMARCVIIGEDGRDRDTERRVLSGSMRGIGERLREGIY
jgi:central kinetochore subunit Mal2/MCM21